MWIVILGLLIGLLVIILRGPSGAKGPRRQGRLMFYSRGMDAGFAMAEIKLLWDAARRAELADPVSLYGSVEELDRTIGCISGDKGFAGREGGDPETVILKKLFEYRTKLEMGRSRYRSGLKSTRGIMPGQKLRIRAGGAGVYDSEVVDNESGYLTITIPSGNPLPPGFSWRGGKLNIYFWRREDAGYFFQTRVIERFSDRQNLHFRIYHSDEVLRSQKRRSVRAPARIPARFFALRNLDEANDVPESSSGRGCLIVNISEDGAALQVEWRGRRNQAFKLHFKVNDELIAVSGVVKRVHYGSEGNESILHVEFLPPSINVRMALLAYVFDIGRRRASASDEHNRRMLAMVSSDSENTSFPERIRPSEEPVNEEDPRGARDEGSAPNPAKSTKPDPRGARDEDAGRNAVEENVLEEDTAEEEIEELTKGD